MPRSGAGPVAGWGGGGGSAVLDGWEAYDATTLTPKAPYQDVRVRNLTVTGTAVITSTTSSTGQFLSANGTAGAPAYSSTNDPNSGIFWNADDTMRFSLGGTERFRGTTTGLDMGTSTVAFGSAIGTKVSQFKYDATFASVALRNGADNAYANFAALGFIKSDYDQTTGIAIGYYSAGQVKMGSGVTLEWTSGAANGTVDTALGRSAAGVVGFYGASASVGSSLAIASGKAYLISSTTDPDGTVDAGLQRSGVNEIAPIVTAGSANVGAFRGTQIAVTRTNGGGFTTIFRANASNSQYAEIVAHGGAIMMSWDSNDGTITTLGTFLGAAAPTARILQGFGSRAGTDANIGGGNLTVRPGNGTGTGTPSTIIFQAPVVAAAGTGAQTQTDVLGITGTGVDFLLAVDGAAAQTATMTNGPTAGNPAIWLKVKIAGNVRYIPAWA